MGVDYTAVTVIGYKINREILMKPIPNICGCENNNINFNFCPTCGKSNGNTKNECIINIEGGGSDTSLNSKTFNGYKLYETDSESDYIYICIDIVKVCYCINENPSPLNIDLDDLPVEKEKMKRIIQNYEDKLGVEWNDNMFNIYTFIEVSC